MNRRLFLQSGLAATISTPLLAALQTQKIEQAAKVLEEATVKRTIRSAVMHVVQKDARYTGIYGKAKDENAMFLLGSISKPVCMTALMTLYDKGAFKLDDPVKKYLPAFTGDGRDQVIMSHLLTRVSGLPDQLPENNELRKSHASLTTFAEHAIRTPLNFAPGTRYQYSSMAILLGAHIADKLSGTSILELVDKTVFQPIGMKHSAQGLGKFKQEDLVPSQTEFGAPEAGAGDPTAKDWDWNSPYWRKLGAPWGGTHCSAPDLAKYLSEFLYQKGQVVKPATAKLMTTNQNGPGLTPRGLGFNVGAAAGSKGCSERTFGHTGSTGTIAWADPQTETICVVLTSLPGRAVTPHPRELASELVAAGAAG